MKIGSISNLEGDAIYDRYIEASQSGDAFERIYARLLRDIGPVVLRELTDRNAKAEATIPAIIGVMASILMTTINHHATPGHKAILAKLLVDEIAETIESALKQTSETGPPSKARQT